MNLERSRHLFEEAQRYLPGGVDSPVRAYQSVGGTPPFIVRGEGSRIYDADGHEYIDYVGSWGPLVLGHAPATVVAALRLWQASEKPPSRVVASGRKVSRPGASPARIRSPKVSDTRIEIFTWRDSIGPKPGTWSGMVWKPARLRLTLWVA